MSDYKKILVAVDFSSAAEEVGRRALDLAERYDAELLFVHVVEYLPPLDVGYDPITTSDWVVDEGELIKNAKTSLKSLCTSLGMGGARQEVQMGTPKHVLPQLAQEEHAELIVIGSHGRHGISRLLGATADGVLHHAECDVLAVRIKE